jgi:acetoin utilization deacetylase AcuC-like enzyme
MTPLHIAIVNGRIRTVMMLIAFGADLTITCEGIPLLHIIIMFSHSFGYFKHELDWDFCISEGFLKTDFDDNFKKKRQRYQNEPLPKLSYLTLLMLYIFSPSSRPNSFELRLADDINVDEYLPLMDNTQGITIVNDLQSTPITFRVEIPQFTIPYETLIELILQTDDLNHNIVFLLIQYDFVEFLVYITHFLSHTIVSDDKLNLDYVLIENDSNQDEIEQILGNFDANLMRNFWGKYSKLFLLKNDSKSTIFHFVVKYLSTKSLTFILGLFQKEYQQDHLLINKDFYSLQDNDKLLPLDYITTEYHRYDQHNICCDRIEEIKIGFERFEAITQINFGNNCKNNKNDKNDSQTSLRSPTPFGIFYSDHCWNHITTPLISRDEIHRITTQNDSNNQPTLFFPENIQRLRVLLNRLNGTLLSTPSYNSSDTPLGTKKSSFIDNDTVLVKGMRKVTMNEILKVHDFSYISSILKMTKFVPDFPSEFKIPLFLTRSKTINIPLDLLPFPFYDFILPQSIPAHTHITGIPSSTPHISQSPSQLTLTLQNIHNIYRETSQLTQSVYIPHIGYIPFTLPNLSPNSHHLSFSSPTLLSAPPSEPLPSQTPQPNSYFQPLSPLDWETIICAYSFTSAIYAAGTLLSAVDAVLRDRTLKSAFVAIRPPGHHTGSRGIVENDAHFEGSLGFCLINNITIAAAYAKQLLPGIRIAIVDFDIHHGNGTQDIVENLLPRLRKNVPILPRNSLYPAVKGVSCDNCNGMTSRLEGLGDSGADTTVCEHNMETLYQNVEIYKPWNDVSSDSDDVMFISTHGYNSYIFDRNNVENQTKTQSGILTNTILSPEPDSSWFYPGTGPTHPLIKTLILEQNTSPERIQPPSLESNAVYNVPQIDDNDFSAFSSSVSDHKNAIKSIQALRDAQCVTKVNTQSDPKIDPKIDLPMFQSNTRDYINISNFHQFNYPDHIFSSSSSYSSLTDQPSPSSTPPRLWKDSKVINAGFGSGDCRLEWRNTWKHALLPALRSHKPNLILISAGFDGHHRDIVNDGFVGLQVCDYEWITREICSVAEDINQMSKSEPFRSEHFSEIQTPQNCDPFSSPTTHSEGEYCRIVSCLEGGYQIPGGALLSPLSQCVKAHIDALKRHVR